MRAYTQFVPNHWALLTKMTENMTSIPDDGSKEGIVSALSQSIDSNVGASEGKNPPRMAR